MLQFSSCLDSLFGSVGGSNWAAAAHAPLPAPTTSSTSKVVDINPIPSHTPPNATADCLPSIVPPDVLARIEANKQAALQRRRAAEAAASSERCWELQPASASHVQAVTHQCTSVQLQQASAQNGGSETRQPAKRHWVSLGAVADDQDD